MVQVLAIEGLDFGFSLEFVCFYNQVVPTELVPNFVVNPQLNWWPKTFIKIPAKENFWWDITSIKLLEDWLEVFEMSYPILNFFSLVLRVLSNLVPNTIYKSFGLSKTFLQKGFKLVSVWSNGVVTLDSGFRLFSIEKYLIFLKKSRK